MAVLPCSLFYFKQEMRFLVMGYYKSFCRSYHFYTMDKEVPKCSFDALW